MQAHTIKAVMLPPLGALLLLLAGCGENGSGGPSAGKKAGEKPGGKEDAREAPRAAAAASIAQGPLFEGKIDSFQARPFLMKMVEGEVQ